MSGQKKFLTRQHFDEAGHVEYRQFLVSQYVLQELLQFVPKQLIKKVSQKCCKTIDKITIAPA